MTLPIGQTMNAIRDRAGTYGPDLILLGLLVTIAVFATALIDALNGLVAAGGVAGVVATRVLLEGHDRLVEAARWLGGQVAQLLLYPLARLTRRAAKVIAIPAAVLAVLGLGYLTWRGGRSHPLIYAGAALILIGLGSQRWWFIGRHAAWRNDNPDLVGPAWGPSRLKTVLFRQAPKE